MAAALDCDIDWQVIRRLVWGNKVKEIVFQRWLQPFIFSEKEPTALIQRAGGPCALLAPLQAFIVKQCLEKKIKDLRSLTQETVQSLLISSICEILALVGRVGKPIVLARVSQEVATAIQDEKDSMDQSTSASKRMKRQEDMDVDVESFHTCLFIQKFETKDNLYSFLEEHYQSVFGTNYDIVAFLYSVILTKGANSIMSEQQDIDETLIDPVHGHGSQSLINLLLTGIATQNVFDGNKDLCGLLLQGIACHGRVGFLSFLECLRYVKVGAYLKEPEYPVWVLGSETHLTVLFSLNMDLVASPTERDDAITAFKKMDDTGSGFIKGDMLGELLSNIGLFSDPEYVSIMKSKLDGDSLGIILMPEFLEEFFPVSDIDSHLQSSFTLFHYNGLSRPGVGDCPQYIKGTAVLLEEAMQHFADKPVLQTLQTKWPTITVDWEGTPHLS